MPMPIAVIQTSPELFKVKLSTTGGVELSLNDLLAMNEQLYCQPEDDIQTIITDVVGESIQCEVKIISFIPYVDKVVH